MPGPRRWRTCLECGYIGAAGTFASSHGANYQDGKPAVRTCPNCRFRAKTDEFPVVERPQEVG